MNTDFEETNALADAQASQVDSRLDVIVQACATQITPALKRHVHRMDASHSTYVAPAETDTPPYVSNTAVLSHDCHSVTQTTLSLEPCRLLSTNVWQQFVILAARHWLNNIRNPGGYRP